MFWDKVKSLISFACRRNRELEKNFPMWPRIGFFLLHSHASFLLVLLNVTSPTVEICKKGCKTIIVETGSWVKSLHSENSPPSLFSATVCDIEDLCYGKMENGGMISP